MAGLKEIIMGSIEQPQEASEWDSEEDIVEPYPAYKKRKEYKVPKDLKGDAVYRAQRKALKHKAASDIEQNYVMLPEEKEKRLDTELSTIINSKLVGGKLGKKTQKEAPLDLENEENYIEGLKHSEEYRATPYRDSRGLLTAGYGSQRNSEVMARSTEWDSNGNRIIDGDEIEAADEVFFDEISKRMSPAVRKRFNRDRDLDVAADDLLRGEVAHHRKLALSRHDGLDKESDSIKKLFGDFSFKGRQGTRRDELWDIYKSGGLSALNIALREDQIEAEHDAGVDKRTEQYRDIIQKEMNRNRK